jgi:hypothetical protein
MNTDFASTTTQMPDDDPKLTAIRAAMIGNKVTIPDTAKAWGVTGRAVYYAVKRTPVPYVVVFGVRYYEPEDLARALVARRNTEPRGRGRPVTLPSELIAKRRADRQTAL